MPWSASNTEQRHGNGGATSQGGSGWAVNGGAQNVEQPDGPSRFSSLFSAPLQQSPGSAGESGEPAYRPYQNGF